MDRYIVTCLVIKTGKTFEKTFTYYDALQKFINKCRFSSKIKVLEYTDKLGGTK